MSVLKLALGVLLLGLAVKQWRGRPRGDQVPHLPAWMKTVDTFTPARSAGIAVAISVFMGERSTRLLGELHDWMARENATIMAVLCLVIGAKLIGDAITALAA